MGDYLICSMLMDQFPFLFDEDSKGNFGVKRIIFSPPATIVFWEDGDKTVVKTAPDDKYSPYFGFVSALAKKVYGSSSAVKAIIDRFLPDDFEGGNADA